MSAIFNGKLANLCIVTSAAACLLVPIFLLRQFDATGISPFLLPALIAFLLSIAIGFAWPRFSWRIGIVISSGCWLFFGVVFVSLWANEAIEWAPGLAALAIAGVSCAGVFLGRRFSPRSADRA